VLVLFFLHFFGLQCRLKERKIASGQMHPWLTGQRVSSGQKSCAGAGCIDNIKIMSRCVEKMSEIISPWAEMSELTKNA